MQTELLVSLSNQVAQLRQEMNQEKGGGEDVGNGASLLETLI
ncbi:MAG: hypothetical protein ACLRMI_00680 [Streptococcus sp.]